MVEIVARNM